MDRITKAIELAKEKNKQKLEQGGRVQPEAAVVANDDIRRVEIDPNHLRKQGVISHIDDDYFSDAFRLLRTRVLQRMRQHGWKTLGITSSHPKAGKSFTAINLGVAIGLDQKHSTLLIDTDMRRPSVLNYFGLQSEIGIAEYLQRDLALQDVILDPGIGGFKLVPCVQSIEGTSELLGGPKMTALIESLKKDYGNQITIFDMPPILVGDDVVTLANMLDAVLVVVEDGVTQSDEFQNALELLTDVNVIGTVLNKSTETDLQQYGGYY